MNLYSPYHGGQLVSNPVFKIFECVIQSSFFYGDKIYGIYMYIYIYKRIKLLLNAKYAIPGKHRKWSHQLYFPLDDLEGNGKRKGWGGC